MLLHHNDFVNTPIESVLEDALSACQTIPEGIETTPLGEYILQSIFMKMTGFQEQKLKCICWDLSTIDYEFRRIWLRDLGKYGEFSSYAAKNLVYKNVLKRIEELHGGKYELLEKEEIKKKTLETVEELVSNSILENWGQRDFYNYQHGKDLYDTKQFAGDSLFENRLKNAYEVMYENRNRYAHNTISYQENIPSLRSIADDKFQYNNFFCWFAILILLDKVFMVLYKTFIDEFERSL